MYFWRKCAVDEKDYLTKLDFEMDTLLLDDLMLADFDSCSVMKDAKRSKFSARGNVDISEKMKLLKQNGMLLMSVVCNGKAKGVEYLESLLTKNVFAPVESDAVVEYIAVINSLEE